MEYFQNTLKLMATPKGNRAQRFLLKSGDALHVYSNAQAITFQLRREIPTEVDVSVVLTPAVAIAVADE